jgi:hypothetical protein
MLSQIEIKRICQILYESYDIIYILIRPTTESEKYYVREKENICVVCAAKNNLIKKNVVPREYRRHFPKVMKNHVSHDILLLCLRVSLKHSKIPSKLEFSLYFKIQETLYPVPNPSASQ